MHQKTIKIGKKEKNVNEHLKSIVSLIWAEVLQYEKIKPEDNFFEIGGDSLMVMMMLYRLNDELQIELPPTAIFENPTLREFCEMIDDKKGSEKNTISKEPKPDSLEEETGIV